MTRKMIYGTPRSSLSSRVAHLVAGPQQFKLNPTKTDGPLLEDLDHAAGLDVIPSHWVGHPSRRVQRLAAAAAARIRELEAELNK